MTIIIGVDATRNRSGGAVSHIRGIFDTLDPTQFGISHIHLWGYKELLDSISDYSWLTKHCPVTTTQSLWRQLLWQRFTLPKDLRRLNCDLVFNTDAGTVCTYNLSVTMSQDMLSFEKGEMKRYFPSLAWLRLFALKYVQIKSLNHSTARIFLTQYAKSSIQPLLSKQADSQVINHGISDLFRGKASTFVYDRSVEVRVIYVSNAAYYKHQWNVVRAIRALRDEGLNVSLQLVGLGNGGARALINKSILECDPQNNFVKVLPFVDNSEIPGLLARADIFLFASSCENMPITLIEGMASGLPIVCSNRGPMPEVLSDTGIYFDPESYQQIKDALFDMITNDVKRRSFQDRSSLKAMEYTWQKCAEETWRFIVSVVLTNKAK